MTAEIAILNKSAVALAAESAVTISTGVKEDKIFDSADKLFELCCNNPIGIMIYNGMSFMEAPLQSLIKQFRSRCATYSKVADAAEAFLNYLDAFGKEAPGIVEERAVTAVVAPLARGILDRVMHKFQKAAQAGLPPNSDFTVVLSDFLTKEIELRRRILEGKKDAEFVGTGELVIRPQTVQLLRTLVAKILPMATDEQTAAAVNVLMLALKKEMLSDGRTGIVIAGFGTGELFPTLVSFEIDGMICGRLKYTRTHAIDIDRTGTKAQVVPFAQKEMVERFLYGLDEGIQRVVGQFCRNTLPELHKNILNLIQFDNESDRLALAADIENAEHAFLQGLDEEAFVKVRRQLGAEIEDMVEFMPKPELAKMAEALVNLTSIKRRVTRGMETVGGPIDVAVISQAEGFVWIKRKHYFPEELNARYFERVKQASIDRMEPIDGTAKPRRTRSARGRTSSKRAEADVDGSSERRRKSEA